MSHRYFTYNRDGTVRFGVWSTISESVICWDMTQEELEDYHVQRIAEKERDKVAEKTQQLSKGNNPYYGFMRDLPPDDVVDELEAGTYDPD